MNRGRKITIVDYGVGNVRSLIRSFEHLGSDVQLSEDPKVLADSSAIVLPGDGAFRAGMDGLKIRNLTKIVKDFAKSGKPVLGICLGAQILMTVGFEFGKCNGLDLISGKVVRFDKNVGEKIPQIGWNSIFPVKSNIWKGTILDGIVPGSSVYFIHSFVTAVKSASNVLAKTRYGKQDFSSVIYKDKIFGSQFHPEKSGNVGLKIINNFVQITNKV